MALPPVSDDELRARTEYLEPLFRYLEEHLYSVAKVMEAARVAAVKQDEYAPWSARAWLLRVWRMRRGINLTPPWFIETCCAVIGKGVIEVMGAAWVERFGADGLGGTEVAPVAEPRRMRPWGWMPQPFQVQPFQAQQDARQDVQQSGGTAA